MATHSINLAWRIPWTEEPGRLQSMGLQRVRHDWATITQTKIRKKENKTMVKGDKKKKKQKFRPTHAHMHTRTHTHAYTHPKPSNLQSFLPVNRKGECEFLGPVGRCLLKGPSSSASWGGSSSTKPAETPFLFFPQSQLPQPLPPGTILHHPGEGQDEVDSTRYCGHPAGTVPSYR